MTMGFAARALVQILAAHFIVSTVLSMVVLCVWRRTMTLAPAPAMATARRLFAWRLLPSVGGLAAAMLVLASYLLWEKPHPHELVGPVGLGASGAGLVLLAAAVTRLVRSIVHTWRIRLELDASVEDTMAATPVAAAVVATAFPVVAIVGLIRSRLFVARQVVEACSAEELAAVLAHEQAHARHHDNLRRLLIAAAPDVLGLGRAGGAIERAWMHFTELGADEWAAGRSERGLHLASALVKVARLATSPAEPLPASALYRGEPIAERVHRLLDPPPPDEGRSWPTWARLALAVVTMGAALGSMPALHAAAERLLTLAR